jgi:FkbM family methyltransferase
MENLKSQTVNIGNENYEVFSDDLYLKQMGPIFEPHMVQLFEALVSPSDVVADIGANIGLTTILFSSLTSHVYAFEPSPSTYQILEKNLTHNQINNVSASNIGLGNSKINSTISYSLDNRSGGFVSEKMKPQHGHTIEDINIDTIDGINQI